MNSKERVLTALKHEEPDRVPFDLKGTADTGIHHIAYMNLLSYIGKNSFLRSIKETGLALFDPI